MRILFINPSAKNLYGQLGTHLIPLGLAYISAVLKNEGHQVAVIDLQVEPIPIETIPFGNYDLVGISSDTPRFNNAVALGRKARALGVPVVFGGYHASFLDEEPLLKNAADFVIRGEGEFAMAELVSALERNANIGSIRGLTYRTKKGIARNPQSFLIEKLDDLPFPLREIFSLDRYLTVNEGRRITTMVTSRGCPFDCYFCAASRFAGLRWRTRSIGSIIRELEQLVQKGYSYISFMDDNFTLDHRRTIDFCDEIIYRKLNIHWWCFSRVDTIVKHPEMVNKMAMAGNTSVFLGLESGNQATLNHYQKRTTVEQQKAAVRILKKHNIKVWGSFILGEMHETKKMIKQTIQFARKLNLETCQFSLLTPYPGSRLFQQMESLQQLMTKNWDLFDGLHLVFQNSNLSAKELQQLLRKAYFKFYLGISNIPAALRALLKDTGTFRQMIYNIHLGMDIIQKLGKDSI
ncbi:MAG: radical SAM protein [Desulfobacterales bacterium]